MAAIMTVPHYFVLFFMLPYLLIAGWDSKNKTLMTIGVLGYMLIFFSQPQILAEMATIIGYIIIAPIGLALVIMFYAIGFIKK